MAQFLYKTVKPSGGDYTSLEACMNANEQDLTGDGWFDVEIDGTWSSADTTAVTIHNYTTTADDYINIYTTSAARHLGVYSTSYYRLLVAGYLSYPLTISSTFVAIVGLQIYGNNTSTAVITITVAQSTINNNIITEIGGNRLVSLSNGGAAWTVKNIFNNIIYTSGSQEGIGIYYYNPGGTINIYNNTIYSCTTGISYYDNYNGGNIKNNLCITNTTDYNLGGSSVTFTNNGSSDLTGNVGFRSMVDTDLFVDTASNYHLKAGAAAIDVGTDLSGTFTDDIDGVTRSGTWDIGADEYVAAGGEVYYTTINNAVICNAIIG